MNELQQKTQKRFLDILKKNEDDLTARLIYADWLDDIGYCEEAERMRLWPESKKWVQEFAEELEQDYNDLLNAAKAYAEFGDCTYDNTETYKQYWSKFEEFWPHFSIVTGLKLQEDNEALLYPCPYTCSC